MLTVPFIESLVLDVARVGALQRHALGVDRKLEHELLAFECAGEIGLTQLTGVMPGDLVAVLLQRDRRCSRASSWSPP